MDRSDSTSTAGALLPPPTQPPIPRSFYDRSPDLVARDFLGCLLISIRDEIHTGGRIVETEAYFGSDDPASHAARLRTGRVAVMAGTPGIAYVYRSYGVHAMLNAVAHAPGRTGAVLIRAIEPDRGLDTMRLRRGVDNDRLLCSGPGRLCQALAIGLDDHGHDLTGGAPFWVARGDPPEAILVGGRIGVGRGADLPLRFFVAGNPFVSTRRRGLPFASP